MADEQKKEEKTVHPVDLMDSIRNSGLSGETATRLSTHVHRFSGEKDVQKFAERVKELRKSGKVNAHTIKDGKRQEVERAMTETEAVTAALNELPP